MKFYIISIVLNVMALFIPVAYYVSNNNEKENKKNDLLDRVIISTLVGHF